MCIRDRNYWGWPIGDSRGVTGEVGECWRVDHGTRVTAEVYARGDSRFDVGWPARWHFGGLGVVVAAESMEADPFGDDLRSRYFFDRRARLDGGTCRSCCRAKLSL